MNNVKKSIGWADYTINPVKGLCPVACKYCYARRLYKRFDWNPEIRYEDPFYDFYALKNKKPSRIFIGSTIELFGKWIRPEWIHNILGFCSAYPQHIFIFLTKYPENLPEEFPPNCWVGATADTYNAMFKAARWLPEVKASVKFISFEPLLESMLGPCFNLGGISWVIIGAQTPYSKKTLPKVEWIKEIVEAADKARIPVFLKNNLSEILIPDALMDNIFWADERAKLRQEFPKSS